jgi:hypothetical protein
MAPDMIFHAQAKIYRKKCNMALDVIQHELKSTGSFQWYHTVNFERQNISTLIARMAEIFCLTEASMKTY